MTKPATLKPAPNGAPKTERRRRGSPDARRTRNPCNDRNSADDDSGDDPEGNEAHEEDRQVFASVWGDAVGDEDADFQISTFIHLHLAYLWDHDLTDEAIEAGAEIPAGMIQSLRQRDWGRIGIPELDKLAAWLRAGRKESDE
jgi:hypothetical protein